MKNFEEPIIVDALDCPEGVYLASGVTPPPHDNPPADPDYTVTTKVTNHDGGSHTDMGVAIHVNKAGNYKMQIVLKTTQIEAVINSFTVCSDLGKFKWSQRDDRTLVVDGNFYANPGENMWTCVQLIFKGEGAYPGHRGGVEGSSQESEGLALFSTTVY